MIPKKIHYCWFGGNPLPKLVRKCIKSWRRYCKDYEIVEWNESNFDINQAPLYVRQAYETKKWAFVSDYVRLYALYQYGGIYLDTDVELIKKIDDIILHKAVLGFETDSMVAMCFIATQPKLPIFSVFLEYYNQASFIQEDEKLNVTTNVCTVTNILLQYGLKQDNTMQKIQEIIIYPKDYFCPKSYTTGKIEKTKNTVAIHHFSASWHTEKEKQELKIFHKQQKRLKRRSIINYITHIPNRVILKLLGPVRYEALRDRFLRKK